MPHGYRLAPASRRPGRLARAAPVPMSLAMAAVAVLAAQPSASAARAAPAQQPHKTMCKRYQHTTVRTGAGARFVVKNDNFGHRRLCLAVSGGWPNFTVSRSSVRSRHSDPQAYPFVLRGCSWGTCSPGSGLPRRVSALRRPGATWYTSQRAGGTWDAAFDIWFGRHRLRTGQARGAELMIWLNARGLGVPSRARVVHLAGTRWYLQHWRACHRGGCWNYLQFRRVRPVTGVHGLRLMPFIHHAEARHLIKRQWWLENIEAGFELWHGGAGLATKWFWARP
jgi:hypothetical protein